MRQVQETIVPLVAVLVLVVLLLVQVLVHLALVVQAVLAHRLVHYQVALQVHHLQVAHLSKKIHMNQLIHSLKECLANLNRFQWSRCAIQITCL